jgi:hypothetical protein
MTSCGGEEQEKQESTHSMSTKPLDWHGTVQRSWRGGDVTSDAYGRRLMRRDGPCRPLSAEGGQRRPHLGSSILRWRVLCGCVVCSARTVNGGNEEDQRETERSYGTTVRGRIEMAVFDANLAV